MYLYLFKCKHLTSTALAHIIEHNEMSNHNYTDGKQSSVGLL